MLKLSKNGIRAPKVPPANARIVWCLQNEKTKRQKNDDEKNNLVTNYKKNGVEKKIVF